jgi:hypothetical protein
MPCGQPAFQTTRHRGFVQRAILSMRLTDISLKDCMGLFHRRDRRGRKEIDMGVEPSCGGDWDARSTCDLLGEERAERDARDLPDNFADQDSDAAVRSCVWPAPGVPQSASRVGGEVESPVSLIIQTISSPSIQIS